MAALVYAANAISITMPIGTVASSTYTFRRLRSWGASVPLIGFTLVTSSLLSLWPSPYSARQHSSRRHCARPGPLPPWSYY